MEELFKAVYNKFISSAVAEKVKQSGDLEYGFYFGIAPTETRMPFIVFDLVSAVPQSDFSSDDLTECLAQFAIYSNEDSPKEVLEIRNGLIAAFDRAELDYDTKHHVGCLRAGERMEKLDDEVWQYIVEYRIMFE